MKDVVNTFKNFTPAQWLNILFVVALGVIGFLFIRHEKISNEKAELIQKELIEQKKASSYVFKLYQDCINKK